MTTKCVIDGDIIAYRPAASSENEDMAIALFRVDDMMHKMLLNLQCEDYEVYLTGSNNFRKRLDPEYKANRKGKPKPKWLQACREHLIRRYHAKVIDGVEADDALGIAASHDLNAVVCSIDKDLLQIPGEHYNFVKDEYQYIGGRQADLNFWTQLLVGDTSDNIKGVAGLGPVKSKKILEKFNTNEDWFKTVRELYKDDKRFLTNLCLFWIHRNEGMTWIHEHQSLAATLPSELVQEVEQKFYTSSPNPSLDSGMMVSDGTLPNGTLTEATV